MLRRNILACILLMVSFVAFSFGQANEPPTITGPESFDISEGPGEKTVSGTYSATDPNNDEFVWTVSGAGFSISSRGKLTFTVTDPDFEMVSSYTATIIATDIHGEASTDTQ